MQKETRRAGGVLLGALVALVSGCTEPAAEPVARANAAILNGHPATAEEHWGTVGLDVYIGEEGGWTCTGTLIGPQLVVTAAHCVLEDGSGPITEMYVLAGVTDLYAPADTAKIYEVSRYVAHPGANLERESDDPSGLGALHDIAIVQTVKPVTQVDVIPVLAPERVDEALTAHAPLVIAGYGVQSVADLENPDADALHMVGDITYVRRSDKEFLAGNRTESDTCVGDSGGPAYLVTGGKAVLVGATSRGRDDTELFCGAGGIYTLVPAYLDWIEENATVPIGEDDGSDGDGDAGVPDDGSDDDEDADAGADSNDDDDGDDEAPVKTRKKSHGCTVQPGAATGWSWL